jgi:HPt (histidine-containing phosphotransfer) domain-containing protein
VISSRGVPYVFIAFFKSTDRQEGSLVMTLPGETPSPEGPTEVIHLEPALRRLGNDLGLLQALAGFFVEDSLPLIAAIQSGCQQKDSELVTRSAHSLKGLASNFDATAATATAAQIETFGREGRLTEAEHSLPILQSQIADVIAALNQQVLNRPPASS